MFDPPLGLSIGEILNFNYIALFICSYSFCLGGSVSPWDCFVASFVIFERFLVCLGLSLLKDYKCSLK
jgi:hypothetical protein